MSNAFLLSEDARILKALVDDGAPVRSGDAWMIRSGKFYELRCDLCLPAYGLGGLHLLAVDSTDGERLLAHWEGFKAAHGLGGHQGR